MIRKHLSTRLWDYGMRWVTDVMNLTYTSARDIATGEFYRGISLSRVTGEAADISEYLGFAFYDQVWYKDNACLGPQHPGRWLGIADKRGNLMCYHGLNEKGNILPRSSVQRVTQLELQTPEYKDMFADVDNSIKDKLKYKDCAYVSSKSDPEDWAGLTLFDSDFNDKFNNIINDPVIKEADEYTPKVLEDTYLNMDLALQRDSEGPEFVNITKHLRDADGIPIGMALENPILESCVYEVEYPDGHKASLAANANTQNIFAQVDDESNRHVLFDEIVDHCTDGTEIKLYNEFITSINGISRRIETNKGWETRIRWKDGSTRW